MKVKKLNIAIIPARYGSKRIKHKNIKKFITKPIILHVIDLLKKSKFFDLIVVSSDSKKILDIRSVDGLLVGNASLNIDEFTKIIF